MIDSLAPSDWLLLARLITAHLLAEWLFQISYWKLDKPNSFSKQNMKQGASAWIISCLVAANSWNSILPIGIIFFSRVLINWWEESNKKMIQKFFISQINQIIPQNIFAILKHLVYLLINTICWIFLVGINLTDIINSFISIRSNTKFWTVGLAYIILIWPTGYLIGFATEFWRKQLQKSNLKGLANAGLWVGRLERALILTFVLLSKFEAIGFLITAKSILRFSEIKSSGDRKEAEYILIGTMMSFVIALLFGIFTTWLLSPVKP